MLKTVFNVDNGLSEDAAIQIYRRSAESSGNMQELKRELSRAFADEEVSWKRILLNEEYEVLDAETEEEARMYAIRILSEPLLKQA